MPLCAAGLQKQQSQAKNAGQKGKTQDQRKEAQKTAAKDAQVIIHRSPVVCGSLSRISFRPQAFVCGICRQTFSNTAKVVPRATFCFCTNTYRLSPVARSQEATLREHYENKHPKETDIKRAFAHLG